MVHEYNFKTVRNMYFKVVITVKFKLLEKHNIFAVLSPG